MQLVRLIIHKIINTLYRFSGFYKKTCCRAFFASFLLPGTLAMAQDNSPYSRYGLGDLVPNNHIINRAMGGISAGHSDFLSINFNNPASYSSFQGIREQKSKKLVMGRAILDIGVNFENRTLREPSPSLKFTSGNALVSYVQVGMPLKNNWGLSFGLRPISRISYNIIHSERLKDPRTGAAIDSATTNFTGSGGAYQVSLGTGFSLFEKDRGNGVMEKLSIGINAHYLFGSKDYSTRRSLLNDTVIYYQANFETKTNFSNLFFDAGIQYKIPLNITKGTIFTLGVYGNWGQKLNATQDIIRETFLYDANQGNVRLDSVSDVKNRKGEINLPLSYTAGFIIQKPSVINKEGGWLFGADYSVQQWDKYRFYKQVDSVHSNWQFRLGFQINPIPKRNYFSNVSYRFGFFMGPDYIRVRKKMQQLGGSFGLGLPVALSRQAPNQVTLINLSMEYGRRGNDQNLLSESLFRISLGFSLSDFWFVKRKYD